MNSKIAFAALLVAAVVVSVIAATVFAPEREVPYPTGDTEGLIAAVYDLRQEVERLSARIEAMENRTVPPGGGGPASMPKGGRPGGSGPAAAAKEGRAEAEPEVAAGKNLESAAKSKAAALAAMEPAELLLLGTLRPGERRSPADRVRYLEELLSRSLETDLRASALFQLGYARRGQGKHNLADEAFREVLTLQPDSQNAANAEYQLAWSCRIAKDYRGAISHYETAVSIRAVRDAYRVSLGLQMADCHLYLEETRAATGILENLVTKYGSSSDASVKNEIARAKAKLKQIEDEGD